MLTINNLFIGIDIVEIERIKNSIDKYGLKFVEKIFKYRFKLNTRNPDYLYNIAIAQILQRKSIAAAETLEELMKFEKNTHKLSIIVLK